MWQLGRIELWVSQGFELNGEHECCILNAVFGTLVMGFKRVDAQGCVTKYAFYQLLHGRDLWLGF